MFKDLKRVEAPLREDVEEPIGLAHPTQFYVKIKGGGGTVRKDRTVAATSTATPSCRPAPGRRRLRAVSAGLDAVDKVFAGEVKNAFCQVRPPGHHAESDRAMGFCLFSNAAIAALYARRSTAPNASPSSISTSTTATARRTSSGPTRTCSTARRTRCRSFPAPAHLNETGVGNICNAPLREGDAGDVFREAFTSRILSPLHNFAPDMVVISAGFDAHKRDPLGGSAAGRSRFHVGNRKIGRDCRQARQGPDRVDARRRL